ncbi:ribonuclease P protein component [Candidatus Parcubacteria bacterium]|nr:ribonuclease P protein component [Candidatus Parcubacteria bacterium]
MLPKASRLTKKKDFDTVFEEGEGIKHGFLVVKTLKNDGPQSRFGIVVSKKISNKATVRNKVKRRLRDAISAQVPMLKKSADVVIVTLSGIQKKEFPELREMISHAFKKLKLI